MSKKILKESAAKKSSANGKETRQAPPVMSSEQALTARRKIMSQKVNVLSDARVYLSGPMDFVASRVEEKNNGWRNRVGQFLKKMGTTVYDPWNKPTVIGMPEYGKEDELTSSARDKWTYDSSPSGDKLRARICDAFWPTLHIDLRMVDTTDFTISYCPTNVYSVGTVHEIVMATLQYKPVLFVSPPIVFPALDELKQHFAKNKDDAGAKLLDSLVEQSSLKVNEKGIPSLWYMALLNAHYFFDGFGFAPYFKDFPSWKHSALDEREEKYPPQRPLLPYLEQLNQQIPKRYDLEQDKYVENEDWLILNSKDVQ
ncbi:MAG: hypothetical protein QOD75_1440 [Blastocatellia bacterium]|nr:hypothetical protein [Blastocatellia bacterium]